MCVKPGTHTHAHTHPLIFLSSPLSVLIYSSILLSRFPTLNTKVQSSPPDSKRGDLKRISDGEEEKKKKELLNISLSTYDQQCVHQRQQNPSVRKIYLIIHQTSEEELPHQQTLWYSEYLMARLVKTRLHFVFWCALTMWDYGDYEERGGGIWRPLLGRRSELTHGKKRSRNDWVLVNIFKFQTSPVKNHRSSYSDIVSLITFE